MTRLGTTHVFLTLSPDVTGTYIIGVLSGHIQEDLVAAANDLLLNQQVEGNNARQGLPTRPERRTIATKNTIAATEYYLRIKHCFVKEVIGWDTDSHTPTERPGLFGRAQWFFLVTETHQSGFLHLHAIVSIEGFPVTAAGSRHS